MSAAVFYESSRHDAYQLPAGILALAVHGAFFALLYFGFAWQTQPDAAMIVELWDSLPESVNAPLEVPLVEEVVQPAQPEKIIQPDIAQPEPDIALAEPKVEQPEPKVEQPEPKVAQPEPDIALPAEKKIEVKPVKKKPAKKADAKPLAQKHVEQQAVEQDQEARIAQQQADLERAEQAAARGRVLNEYKTKIQNKITRNIVMPPGVPDDALAVFRVTLLPGGSILSAVKQKSSGNAAYDNSVERAILKSDPLPLPPDPAMFKDFRVLRLEFQPRRMKE
jgi:colicin import membrane protein